MPVPPSDPLPTAPEPQSPADDSNDPTNWGSALRTAALIAAVLVMVWIGITVRLPELDELRTAIDGFGWWSWLVFVGAYAVVALTPIPVTIMALTGGVLFGALVGSLLSVVGALLGGLGAYWIARGLGQEAALRLLGSHRNTLEKRLESAGFEAVFTLRAMPGLPYWPVNYAAGALGVPFREFALASAVASVPGQVALVAIGAFVAQPSTPLGIVVVTAWAATISLTIWAVRSWKGTASRPLPGSKSGP